MEAAEPGLELVVGTEADELDVLERARPPADARARRNASGPWLASGKRFFLRHDQRNRGPDNVWSYTKKLVSDDGVKEWLCIWCKKKFRNFNSTKAMYHQAAATGHEVAPCLGSSNGTQPSWFTASLRAMITRKKAVNKNNVQVSPFCVAA